MPKLHEIRHRLRVPFADTDMAGITHFSNILRYVEAAEAALFREIGEPLIHATPQEATGWPRVRIQCDFSGPLFFDDEAVVHLSIREIKIKAIEYGFRVTRVDPDSGDETLAAKGTMTTLAARIDRLSRGMRAADIPASVLRKIEPAPRDQPRR